MKCLLRTLLAFLGLASLAACGGGTSEQPPSPTGPVPVSSVTVSPDSARIAPQQTTQLTATPRDASGNTLSNRAVTWASSAAAVATVSNTGLVVGITVGVTTISASIEGKTASATVTVSAPPVASLTVSPTSLFLTVGQSQKAVAVAKDAAGNPLANRAISWSIVNGSIASVTSDGTVTGIAAGLTGLSASSEGVTGTSTVVITSPVGTMSFDYGRDLGLTGAPRTLTLNVTRSDAISKSATVSGADSRAPTIPFTFAWGDGSSSTGFFPQTHTYASATQNYVVRVTAHYSTTTSDSADVVVRFVAANLAPVSFPASATVTIPQALPNLTSRQAGYGVNPTLQPVPDSFFSISLPRATLEYVLSQAATIELGILENDVEKVSGTWHQVVLYDPSVGFAYSIWYTSPIALGSGSGFLSGVPGYSSLFHEMGHNLSLNAPAAFRYGGRVDGPANAIFSEAVAQMFQHAVAYELVNNAPRYGLPIDLASDIAGSAHASAQTLQQLYTMYLAQGKPFTTWNDPATSVDETLGSFIALAHQFMVHAEQSKTYIEPLTRVMRLLRTFNSSLASQYAPLTNAVAANTFRSTLMVAAVSYGFQQDLRTEFRGLNFPIDDAIYAALYASVPLGPSASAVKLTSKHD